jgi:murein DD-endopeptidase MepM/ murein hydrolase activator NlpD
MTAGSPIPEIAFSATAWTEMAVGIEYHDRAAATSTNAAEHFVEVAATEKRVRDMVEDSEARVEAELAELTAKGDELSRLRGELNERNLELEAEQKKQRSILAEVDAQLEEWEHDIVALGREQASIEALIAERAAAAAAAAAAAEAQKQKQNTLSASSASAGTPSPATTAAPTTTAAPSRSGLVRPVPGGVSSGYGNRVHPIHGGVRLHTGWDMNGGMGQPIVSAASGTVIYAGVKGGYGNTLMVDHGGGMVTLYAHQSKFAVGYGASVGAGQVIGYVGSTGDSTGPHLHFEVRIGGSPVNPSRYL